MLRKLLVFTAISAICSVAVNAQDTSKDKSDKRVQAFGFVTSFDRSYLGVQTIEISKENFAKFGLSQVRGVGVEKVVENSPAANAGLQNGDVIIRFDGEEVKSVSKLMRLIGEVSPDQIAKVTVLRGGSEREFNVTLGKREFPRVPAGNFGFENLPALPRTPRVATVPLPPNGDNDNVFVWRGSASRQIGVGVTPLTKQLGDYFGVAEGKGLLINSVRENSPADKAGLKAGDIIVEVEGKEVKGQIDLIRAISDKKDGDIGLTFIRERNRQTVRVTPEAAKDGGFGFEPFDNIFENVPAPTELKIMTPQPQIAPLSETPLKIAPRILK